MTDAERLALVRCFQAVDAMLDGLASGAGVDYFRAMQNEFVGATLELRQSLNEETDARKAAK